MTTDEKLNQLIDFFINMYTEPCFLMTPAEIQIALKKIKEGEEIKKEKEFDPTKPVQTRDGRKARIIFTDLKASQPLVVLVSRENGIEDIETYTIKGKRFLIGDDPRDLINI